jgi:hypothetical protein
VKAVTQPGAWGGEEEEEGVRTAGKRHTQV